ncbi:MAG TPA: DUF3710 domain-containing protein [Pseudoclavibacter sp.]|nr:DUF3710 domain-containing protein [Pseudoclavibacter sp.]
MTVSSANTSRAKEAPADREVNGPFDAREAIDVKPYVDFGGLLVRPREGLQIRLEIEEESKRVVAITLDTGGLVVQVQAFACSRSEGLWSEIRSQVEGQISSQGGAVTPEDGELGTMLRVKIPQPSGGTREVLFVGVDGPRWFLRGVMSGPKMHDPDAVARGIEVFRSIVVNRGSAPMPPRDLLPLRIPAPPVTSRNLGNGTAHQ